MVYQENSYGPRSTYAGPTNNAGHFPHSHSHSHSQSHQQQSPFYPNPYPQSNQSNASPPPPPLPSYIHPQPSEIQTYHQPQRLPYGPNQFHFQNGRAPLMQPPISLPDDHFKKPYLPQQQYMNHGPLLFHLPFSSSSRWHESTNNEMALADTMTGYIPQLNHPPIS